MDVEEISTHLDHIEEILKETVENRENGPDLKNKKEQFRIIDQSIRQLRNKDFPVPEEMNAIRNNLIAEIEKHSLPVAKLQEQYEKVLDIVLEFGRICKRSPRKDLYLRAKKQRSEETDIDTLAKVLVNALEGMGGSGREKFIFQKVGEDFKGKLTKADMACPKGKTPRWQSTLKRARKKLINEGILTEESKGRKWTLAG